MSFGNFLKENIVYIIIFIAALIVALMGYGVGSTVQTIAVFYCIIQSVVTLLDLNRFFILKFIKKREVSFNTRVILWFITVVLIYVAILNPYFQKFVFYAIAVTISILLVYQIVVYALRKLG